MKKLIAGVVLGVGLTAMAHGAGDPEAGEANAAVCAGCHGQDGAKPVMAVYPKLAGIGEASRTPCNPSYKTSKVCPTRQ